MALLDIDFARSRPRLPALAWVLLAIGLVAAALALSDMLDARSQWQQAAQALQSAPAVRETSARPIARVVPGGPAATAASTRASEAARAALARPWGPLLRTLEAHTPATVALLSLEATGSAAGAGSLRLVGEARDVADAVAYVEVLRAAAPIRSAELTHHESREVEGIDVLRFSIDLVWGGGAP